MDNEFKFIESIERGTASLNGIIDASRWMEAEIAKRKRTQRIVLIVLVVVFGAAALYVAFRLLNPRSSQVDRDFAMILGGALVAIVLMFGSIIVFGIRSNTTKPYARYKAALAKSYPGLDTSSENAIKSYVWNYANKPDKLLANLFQLLKREGEQRKIRGDFGDVYTHAEHVFLSAWTTNNIYGELYGLHKLHEEELDLLAYSIADFREIGAYDEAQTWSEARALFCQLRPREGALHTDEVMYLSDLSDNADDLFEFTKEQKVKLDELAERLTTCRPETEQKLFEYVLVHKAEFVLGAA